jgi:glycosyltransferase involved in cell wall biosynthesis
LKIPSERIQVINGGINLSGYERSPLPLDPPVIGYLCRLSEYFGLGIVVDAFLELKKDSRFQDLKLYATGGYTGVDKPFVNKLVSRIAEQGFADDFQIFKNFDKSSRIQFLKSLTLLSVPVPSGEAFGAYQVEALAAGVPVVQPNVGCYPEFVNATQGGLIYEPNTGAALAQAMTSLLEDHDRMLRMGRQGRDAVRAGYSIDDMVKNMLKLYKGLVGNSSALS